MFIFKKNMLCLYINIFIYYYKWNTFIYDKLYEYILGMFILTIITNLRQKRIFRKEQELKV